MGYHCANFLGLSVPDLGTGMVYATDRRRTHIMLLKIVYRSKGTTVHRNHRGKLIRCYMEICCLIKVRGQLAPYRDLVVSVHIVWLMHINRHNYFKSSDSGRIRTTKAFKTL